MTSVMAAYLGVWLGVMGYRVRLAFEHRRLAQTVDALRAQLESPDPE